MMMIAKYFHCDWEALEECYSISEGYVRGRTRLLYNITFLRATPLRNSTEVSVHVCGDVPRTTEYLDFKIQRDSNRFKSEETDGLFVIGQFVHKSPSRDLDLVNSYRMIIYTLYLSEIIRRFIGCRWQSSFTVLTKLYISQGPITLLKTCRSTYLNRSLATVSKDISPRQCQVRAFNLACVAAADGS